MTMPSVKNSVRQRGLRRFAKGSKKPLKMCLAMKPKLLKQHRKRFVVSTANWIRNSKPMGNRLKTIRKIESETATAGGAKTKRKPKDRIAQSEMLKIEKELGKTVSKVVNVMPRAKNEIASAISLVVGKVNNKESQSAKNANGIKKGANGVSAAKVNRKKNETVKSKSAIRKSAIGKINSEVKASNAAKASRNNSATAKTKTNSNVKVKEAKASSREKNVKVNNKVNNKAKEEKVSAKVST